jgi:hypothetical protein
MFDMALEALEGVLSQKAARSCLEAGLSVQGKAMDTASLEDYRAALRSNVFRQLQVVMPATAAAQLIREVEFQLEQLDNERTELDSRRAGFPKGAVPQTMVDDGKSTAIRDPDLLAMAGSNLLSLNLRTLGSLSVEFGDVLFAERDLKLEVRALRRMLDEGQPVERAKIESLRETLRSRRDVLLVEQRAQLETLDHRIHDLSQRVVVPRELEARLESARRLLASGTLATSDLRQMERLIENVAGEPIAPVPHGSVPVLESEPEPVLESEPEPVLESEPVAAAVLDPELTPVFASEPEQGVHPEHSAHPEPALEPDAEPVLIVEGVPEPGAAVALEPEPEHAITHEPPSVPEHVVEYTAGAVTDDFDGIPSLHSEAEITTSDSFEPVVSAQELNAFAPETAPEADPVIASVLRSFEPAPHEPMPHFEPEAEAPRAISQPEPALESEAIGAFEPEAAEAIVTEPAVVLEPELTEAVVTEPDLTLEPEPESVAEPEVVEAVAALEPEVHEPKMLEPEHHELEHHEPEHHEPEHHELEDLEPEMFTPEAHLETVVEHDEEAAEPHVEAAVGHEPEADAAFEPEAAVHHEPEPALEPEAAVVLEPEPEATHAAVETETALEPELAASEPDSESEAITAEPEPATAMASEAVGEPESVGEHTLEQESELVSAEPEMEPVAAVVLEPEPAVVLEPEPEHEAAEAITEPEPTPEPVSVEPLVAVEAESEDLPEPVAAEGQHDSLVEPESEPAPSTEVEPAPAIEPDLRSWYAPSLATMPPSAHLESVVHDESPVFAPSYITANSGLRALREETHVENETVQEHSDAPIQSRDAANAEEGIVWLASARRDASSRNADRLRKDPMALKPGRLESEHALAEAEAHVLEAKLNAASDGASIQHRRLEAEFALKVAQAAVELASKRVEAVGLRERYGAASKAELEHAQLELERAQEELALARLSEGVVPNVVVSGEPNVNRVEVDAERLKVALQSTPQMLSARHTLERAELELAIRDNPAYPASEIASVRNVVNQAREHFSTLESTLHAELEAALASMRYYGARMGEREGASKTAENELHHAEEGVRQGFVASLTRDEAQLKALRADMDRRKAAHKYLEAVHRLQCLTHQYMLG